jgi:hypothetical protein
MHQLTRSGPDARPVLHAALATLALTALHHLYGGLIYATPWRLHGAALATAIGGLLAAVAAVYTRTHRRIAGVALAAGVVAIPVLATGAFEGAYNHVAKNLLYAAGAAPELLARLFPPPRYELPDDAVFELSGVAQVVPAAVAALAVLRFVRGLRHGVPGCDRPACRATFALRCLTSVAGAAIELPDPAGLVHLQFRRFAGCPVCNLHLRSFARRHAELEAAGIREVVVFHSPPDELRGHVADLPFAVIGDPDRRLYRELGVESGRRALLDPRAWGTIVVAVLRGLVAVVRGRERLPSLAPHGGRFGLPADFLIDPSGRILACKHGEHAADQWSVDQVLAEAHAWRANPATRSTARGACR